MSLCYAGEKKCTNGTNLATPEMFLCYEDKAYCDDVSDCSDDSDEPDSCDGGDDGGDNGKPIKHSKE